VPDSRISHPSLEISTSSNHSVRVYNWEWGTGTCYWLQPANTWGTNELSLSAGTSSFNVYFLTRNVINVDCSQLKH